LKGFYELGEEEGVFFIFIVFSSPFGSFWKLADEIMVKLIGMWQMVFGTISWKYPENSLISFW